MGFRLVAPLSFHLLFADPILIAASEPQESQRLQYAGSLMRQDMIVCHSPIVDNRAFDPLLAYR